MESNDTQPGQNGTATSAERNAIREKLRTFVTDGAAPPDTPDPPSDPGAPKPERDEELHAVKRHPEDPPEGLKTGVGEQSLLDPDAMRVIAVDVGITMQALEPERLDPMLEAEYGGLLGIRRGAVEGPALQEAGGLAATEASTDREVAALAADGLAAADDAARHQVDVMPRLDAAVEKMTKEHEDAVAERDEFEKNAVSNPDYWTSTGTVEPTPAGGPFHWLPITPGRAKVAGAVEVVVGGLVLSGPVGEAISLDFPFGSVLIGMALSLMLFLLGWFGGKALAAVQLPVRLVAALFALAAVWIVWRSTASMDALRTGDATEGKKILTAATLSNIYIAALTSYAASVYGVFERRRELIASIPTPIDLWRVVRNRLEAKVAETKVAKEQAESDLQAGLYYIADRKSTAAGTDGRCRRREAEGVTAGAGYETLKAVTAVHLGQEDDNRDAAVTAGKLAHTKTRAEAYPEVDTTAETSSVEERTEQFGGLNPFHKAAIVCLLIGPLGGLFGSQIVLTLGVAAAAVLLLLGLSSWAKRRVTTSSTSTASGVPVKHEPPVISLPGLRDAPGWKVPPRSTQPKYGTAPNDPTQHH